MVSQGVHYGQGGLDEKVEFRAWDCDMGCGDAKQRITAERHSYSRKLCTCMLKADRSGESPQFCRGN